MERLKFWLRQSNYNQKETDFLLEGFSQGFNLEYAGPTKRQSRSKNIPFTVRNKTVMWNKLMKEIKEKRVAGPFVQIPFTNYAQSPIILVPKARNSGQTRLIFHLSYNFSDGFKSINHYIPQELCSVKYNDLDYAVKCCLEVWNRATNVTNLTSAPITTKQIACKSDLLYLSKTDLKSAFRILPLSSKSYPWVIMQCQNPVSKQTYFFVDKVLPFGSSISYSHFQRFSNCLRHIIEFITGQKWSCTNYLDDYLFISESRNVCNQMVRQFLTLCHDIRFPVSVEKTEWATTQIIFLGILIDGANRTLAVPLEKRI